MKPRRILAIDDVPAFTRMLKLNLESAGGYTVCMLNDGRDAVASARAFKPDLILLDLVMPGTDGETVAAELRSDPATRDIPIIFLSAMSRRSAAAPPAEGTRFLSKPVLRNELMRAIDAAMAESA